MHVFSRGEKLVAAEGKNKFLARRKVRRWVEKAWNRDKHFKGQVEVDIPYPRMNNGIV